MIAALATVLAGCSNDDENVVDNGPVAAQISAGVNAVTRAQDATWEADAIGVMVTGTTGSSGMQSLYRNVKYKTTAETSGAANFTAEGSGIFFQDATETVTFAAYAPYQTSPAANALPGADGVIHGSTDIQDNRETQKAFDFIYASGATASRTNPEIQFAKKDDFHDYSFTHKMTRLVIIVKTSADYGFTAAQVTEGIYALTGLKHVGEFNVTTGEAKAATGASAVDNWSLSEKSLKTADETTQCTFTSILYPQTLAKALTFTATIDGKTYTNSTDINPALTTGTSYEYTITVKKTGLTVSGCTITDWSKVTGVGGDATMQ